MDEGMIARHLPLVTRLAWRMKRLHGGSVDIEDLISDGRVGLVAAARRFDRRRGVPFAAFALRRILGAMLDGYRRDAPLSRRDWTRTGDTFQLVPVHDDVASSGDDPERNVLRAETFRRLARGLATLTPRERRFLELHYARGQTLARAGRALGLSRSWACRLHRRAVTRVAMALND